MKQFKYDEFKKIIEKNGFRYSRCRGSHSVFINNEGKHITVPKKLKSVIANRLLKENNIKYERK